MALGSFPELMVHQPHCRVPLTFPRLRPREPTPPPAPAILLPWRPRWNSRRSEVRGGGGLPLQASLPSPLPSLPERDAAMSIVS